LLQLLHPVADDLGWATLPWTRLPQGVIEYWYEKES
jgi:hypothetical protein